ncbi:MAG: hypothetical protein P8016_05305 [Sedimentisphaerales bacterium]
MKIAAIRSHRLYKPVMLGSALLIFIIALMVSYFMNKDRKKAVIYEPDLSGKTVIRRFAASQLDKEPNELTDKDFAGITELSVGQEVRPTELYDIKLLEKFVNLRELNLLNLKYPEKNVPQGMSYLEKTGIYDPSEMNFFDLSPLKNLSKLRRLKIHKTPVNSIEQLKGLTNLQALNVILCDKITEEQVKELQKALPNLIIQRAMGGMR